MQWDNPNVFEAGDLFIGQDNGQEVGVTTERHAITIAGAGSGKGATTIIPNIKRWNANLLVIDPKGENARETVNDREAMGQKVYVVDPFERSKVDARFLASYNPMSEIDIHGMTAADDINAIADGIVMRGQDASSENWDDGALEVIAGVIAYSLLEGDEKNLAEVRDIIIDKEVLQGWASKCESDTRLGGLLRAGASRVLAREGEYYVSNAQKNTAWLDREPIKNTLSMSDFNLSELKNGNITVYLVLPANYLVTYGRFLRTFVRCAIEEMARPTPSGEDRNKQCLFLLDEFFSLGYIKEIAVSSGLMRGYGLQLWPIMQDLGQLVSLYGQEGSQTFFANADLHQFFGVSDNLTAGYVSTACGVIGMNDLDEPPPMPPSMPASTGLNMGGQISSMAGGSQDKHMRTAGMAMGGLASMVGGVASASVQASNQRAQEEYQEAMVHYQRQMQQYGRPHLEPDDVKKITQKKDNVVADYSINIVYGTDKWAIEPLPYFQEIKEYIAPKKSRSSRSMSDLIGLVFLLAVGAYFMRWGASPHDLKYGWNSTGFYVLSQKIGLKGSVPELALYTQIMFSLLSIACFALWYSGKNAMAFLIPVAIIGLEVFLLWGR